MVANKQRQRGRRITEEGDEYDESWGDGRRMAYS